MSKSSVMSAATWLHLQIFKHFSGEEARKISCLKFNSLIQDERIVSIPGLVDGYHAHHAAYVAAELEKNKANLSRWQYELSIEQSPRRRQNLYAAISRCERYIAKHVE